MEYTYQIEVLKKQIETLKQAGANNMAENFEIQLKSLLKKQAKAQK